ncbi:Fe-S cluster assembly protein IscX [Gammaproteobacteria bacterium]|jgi:FeS assembly protein IscX|nr:Fe-S cluster assembly protein IscX [Gammaproteobacteria bacterium]MDA9371418.1 Fe-S cluster assembly protein IscX [Gammaproteobacteria bacterium]MDC1300379.1 Fe-S cluster assembly protein IscX [Gammaproteobacteria bacterium]MDC1525379.1 Fe-S cluster assembly protein IscX [Gammaproteobacteria bacterium]
MEYKWSDIIDIAIDLNDTYPEIDPQWISFPDLHKKICTLANFNDDPLSSNEKILEAIQMAWMDESD